VLQRQGWQPAWDGKQEIYIREAFPEEYAKWQASYARASARARAEGENMEEDEQWVVFFARGGYNGGRPMKPRKARKGR
jgi:hypothetical protein